jgi:hypothetical protein
MDERQHLGVQAEAVDRAVLVTMTVLAVTHYRTSFGGKVNTDLVRAPGFQMQFDEGIGSPLPTSP